MPTILVLDDDQVILDLLQTDLPDAGYDTIVFPEVSGIPPEARADLVITDLVPQAYRRDQGLAWVTSLRQRVGESHQLIVTPHAPAVAKSDMLVSDGAMTK